MEILAVLRRGLVTDAGDDVEARKSLLEIEMEWKQTGLTLDLHQRLMEYLQYFVAKARAGIYNPGQLPVEFFDLFSRQIQALGTNVRGFNVRTTFSRYPRLRALRIQVIGASADTRGIARFRSTPLFVFNIAESVLR